MDRLNPVARKEKPVTCPFCDDAVPRPVVIPQRPEATGGRCSCGAVFISDVTGKGGGQAVVDGLALLCDNDVDRGMGLSAGVDYEVKKLGYRPQTHAAEPHMPGHGAFGRPKLWFFRLLS